MDKERSFLDGGGEMGALMRAHDWSTSPLGDPSIWPQSLRTTVSLMLNSRYPMFVAWGPRLAFLYNDGYRPIFGAKHPHTLGLPFEEVWSEIWDDVLPLVNRALAGEPTFNENLHLVMERNGYPEDTWYTFSYSPVRDESGGVGGMFCACQETTGRVLAEAALRQGEADLRQLNAELETRVLQRTRQHEEALAKVHELQKMEVIGQLTGGVAHDFNNLLQPIVSVLDLVRLRPENDDKSARLITGALQSAQRARTLISRLLTFARRQHLEPCAVDIGALTAGMEDLIARSIGPQIQVLFDFTPDTPAAYVDPAQLELAILNLVVNSRDAMPAGGVLTIGVDHMDPRKAGLENLPPHHYVRLWVSDTGCGMDAETLKRAVEPFFSTKGVGKGTGLGLSMVHGLAAQSGGALRLTSSPGQGTSATLWLPVAHENAQSLAKAGEFPIERSQPKKILLVDDEELVRNATAEMLAGLGHEVQQAGSGAQALEMLAHDDGFGLLISDYLMPGMDGAEFLRQARDIRPRIPALLITGYSRLAEDIGLGVPRLAKPFRQSELAAAIAELDGGNVFLLPTALGRQKSGSGEDH